MLKKEDPQIIAKNINKNKSKVFASLITSNNCKYVINAQLIYIFNITIKKFLIYVQFKKKTTYY